MLRPSLSPLRRVKAGAAGGASRKVREHRGGIPRLTDVGRYRKNKDRTGVVILGVSTSSEAVPLSEGGKVFTRGATRMFNTVGRSRVVLNGQ